MTKIQHDKEDKKAKPGVWNRGTGSGPKNPIRVRTKRLDEIDSDRIALAYWLLAKQVVADGTGKNITEDEAKRVAKQMEDDTEVPGQKRGRNA